MALLPPDQRAALLTDVVALLLNLDAASAAGADRLPTVKEAAAKLGCAPDTRCRAFLYELVVLAHVKGKPFPILPSHRWVLYVLLPMHPALSIAPRNEDGDA